MLEMLKNGSGIHIKKKNRGSFRRWCGGDVTDECIRRGKNSPNPKIRKKATFADNARKWKHADGGILKCQKGSPWLSREEQAYNDRLMSKKGSFMVDSIYNRNIDPIKGAGVAGSMALESSFNPNARGGSHLGYVQNEPRIINYIKRNYGGYDHNAQIRFLLDGLTKGLPDSTSVMGRDLQTRFNNYNWKTYKTPEEAARAWEKSYEKSGGQGNNQRLYYSRMFYNLINNKLRGHKKGGSLSKKSKRAFVPGVSITDSNPNAYKYVKKHYKMKGQYGGSIPKELDNSAYIQQSSMYAPFVIYGQTGNDYLEWKQKQDEINLQRELQKQSDDFQRWSGIGEQVLNLGVGYLSNKGSNTSNVSTPTYFETPKLQTSLQTSFKPNYNNPLSVPSLTPPTVSNPIK